MIPTTAHGTPVRKKCIRVTKWLLAACCTLLVACGSSVPGLKELEKACKEDAVLMMDEVFYVDGYFNNGKNCDGCVEEIIKFGFRFIEFNLETPEPYDPYQEPGLWRLERVAKDSGECNARISTYLNKVRNGGSPYTEFVEKYCIATYKIDELQSDFEVVDQMDWMRVLDNGHASEFAKFTTQVSDIATGELVAKKVSFSLFPWPNDDLAYGTVKRCDYVGVPTCIEGKGCIVQRWALRANPEG